MVKENFREYDIVIFGASACVGHSVIEEMINCMEAAEIKWAIAGRNYKNLKEALVTVQNYSGNKIDITNIPIIVADVENSSSIIEMCKRTKLLLNCVGPYNECGGEEIVSACIECKTHCIDLIQACGIGSLPEDYAIEFLMQKFPGGLNSVEFYQEFFDGPHGKTIGYGTFISILNSLRDYFNSSKFEREVQEKVFNKKPKKMKFPLKFGWIPMLYSWKEKAWCIKNMGPDVRNIRRSQMFRANYTDNGSLIDVQGYLKLPSLMKGLFYAYVFFLCLFTVFGFGKSLLMKRQTFFLEPAYPFTAKCMVQSGLTLLKEQDKMPLKGGVLTPGVAFGKTTIQKRLEKSGVTFKLEDIS
ncbi:saccharopine dehydrogenase-like oxidoreductase [Trichonephila inaurata madagascariensis]|uniref:Saccharopine dehydrogenase-like oxidoreductase n=1 Tax=Trichonephila inaurata madagascariensis TaxID=2747483 RepID=A0A8X6MKA8_9ARAC|nr:saccharopine dehydrogenase-like oxidoreductase [Trichonephila inaurata madagascariensis]